MTTTPMSETHECVFVEEQEPNGRLILGPCIVCNLSAMDALTQVREEGALWEGAYREEREKFSYLDNDNRETWKRLDQMVAESTTRNAELLLVRKDLEQARGLVVSLENQLAQVVDLHQPSHPTVPSQCRECGFEDEVWPCDTYKLVGPQL